MKIRGFEIVSKYQSEFDEGKIKLPKRGTKLSAGYDFFNNTGSEIVVAPGEITIAIPTKVKVYMEKGVYLGIIPRSSMRKTSTRIANTLGVIDADYYNNADNEGEIFVTLHNQSDKLLRIPVGQGFVQGIFTPFLLADGDSFDVGEDRIGGFGSTTGKI